MATKRILRLAGIVLLVLGICLAIFPDVVRSEPVPADLFLAVERRVWWGFAVGSGLFLILRQQWHPLLLTISFAGAAMMTGILTVRLIGISLDGPTFKQWAWVATELAVLVIVLIWYFRLKKRYNNS